MYANMQKQASRCRYASPKLYVQLVTLNLAGSKQILSLHQHHHCRPTASGVHLERLLHASFARLFHHHRKPNQTKSKWIKFLFFSAAAAAFWYGVFDILIHCLPARSQCYSIIDLKAQLPAHMFLSRTAIWSIRGGEWVSYFLANKNLSERTMCIIFKARNVVVRVCNLLK